jgi:molybdopterin-guanine dinucleotide biosynthesis protein B
MGGVAVASGCYVERRTMRVLDYGKLAATFVDTHTGRAVRVHPAPDCRTLAEQALPNAPSSWHSQLEGYQTLPDETLFSVQPVELTVSMEAIISQPNRRVSCAVCGEEITNDRQVLHAGQALCRSCAGDGYYAAPSQPAIARRNGQPPIPVVTIIGKSGSGKTTLMEKVVKELTDRGYRIATIKHHSHRGFEIDVPGKDSWRFAQAGSRHVIIASPDRFAAYRQLDGELSLDEITPGVDGVDLILVEGYKQANKPAIEVVRAANSQDLIGTSDQRIAIVSDLRWNLGVPLFQLDDAHAIAEWIENRFITR